MDTKIITKFIVGTEQGIDTLLLLTPKIAIEKFTDLLDDSTLQNYITENYNEKKLIVEVNSMSNQWLVVYVNDQPAGYARITSKGIRPNNLDRKRIIRIADFGILKKYVAPDVRQSLFDKCMYLCKSYNAIWVNEYIEDPMISFFETEGFLRNEDPLRYDGLPLLSVCLIKEQI